ncbi:MAG: DUF1573 domain-containing protein [Bacteroidaceae bacterium]|nr:DUF1573 domain-containing protein [Bacteroidaceae bacterium]
MKLFRCLLLIIGLSLFVSCQETERERFTRMVNEWMGKEIKFPEHSVFTVQGKDTVDFDYQDANYKIVSYIDSVGCTGCKLKLDRWKMFMEELSDKHVSFLFFFHPKDLKELHFLTRQHAFTYPICFDEKDVFNSLNRFPSDMTFQTFLLDKDNKVISVGNPVHNPKVKELYLKHITGRMNSTMSTPNTSVSLSELEKDFGVISLNEKREHVFKLVNTGNKPLVIYDVVTSCGCTKAEYSKTPVRPGETLDLNVIYNAEDKGFFRKSLMVYCNVEESPLKFSVLGTVE